MAHLVKICSGIWSDAFEDLHVLDEALTGGFDLGLVRSLWPVCANDSIDQTVAPGRVKAHRLRVHAGNLAACNEAVGFFF